MKRPSIKLILPFFLGVIFSCTRISEYSPAGKSLQVFPDFSGTTVPYNIAPLNFYIHGDTGRYLVRFIAGADSFDIHRRNKVMIPQRKWKRLLNNHKGENLTIRLFSEKNKKWLKYQDMTILIAAEPVDPYIAYRLIEPGYEFWGEMGIYQRHLESFEETPVMVNTLTDGNCMNCHSFHKNNPEKMLFHMRAKHAGTIVVKDGEVKKIDTKTPDNVSAGVYPRWHPNGRFIAFSVNQTSQAFHTVHENLIEVYDRESDIIIYDTEKEVIYISPVIHSADRFETYPEWSPDGKSLFFCSAGAKDMPQEYQSLKYDLFRVDFDPQTGKIGNKIDTTLLASSMGKSVAHPRISPDGKQMVICLSNFGTFPIWHKENDLYLLDMQTHELNPITEVNSTESDSYHSWSTNGNWMVFGSRRIDGLYTRPYIAYFDSNGKFHPPFLLPQKDPLWYDESMKSYNIPEFISGKIKTSIRTFERVSKGNAKILKSLSL
ncbi:MAG: hypothetical protein LBQ60_15105 [Bacteroidales bacterium]|jgi:hypothetical protein|nr:hypothetical protein [Bacteroidales bacterium]